MTVTNARLVAKSFRRALCAAPFLATALSITPAFAAEGMLERGDAALTGFSGTTRIAQPSDDTTQADITGIDVGSPSLRVFDLARLGGKPAAQLADAPLKFSVAARDIGQVFAVTTAAMDTSGPPDLYAAATSFYGLQIVTGEGSATRLARGQPGARWMDGQFGPDGGPGSIWKIDGRTGKPSLFADIRYGGEDNAGPGLGGLAFDPASLQFFATDLETGLIHRLDVNGRDSGTFDHGVDGRPAAGQSPVAYVRVRRVGIDSAAFSVEDPATWSYADKRRMVVAVTVQGGRLYYSVAEGRQVWSVGIEKDGDFANDARRELEVGGGSGRSLITAIAFDGPDRMLIAERGAIAGSYDFTTFAEPGATQTLRFAFSKQDDTWAIVPDEYAIGLQQPHRSGLGGLALGYGYDRNGRIDYGQCRATLWATGEHLRNDADARGARHVHGLQGQDKSLAKPQSNFAASRASLALLQADFAEQLETGNERPDAVWFVDADGRYADADANGHIGAVAIVSPCDPAASEKAAPVPATRNRPTIATPVIPKPATPGVYIYKTCFPGVIGGIVHCRITVQNIGLAKLAAPVVFTDVTTVLGGPGAGGQLTIASATPDAPGWVCSPTPADKLACTLGPAGLKPGATRHVDVFVETGPLVAAGGLMFRNCASLAGPWSGIACDEAGAELELEKVVEGPCVQGQPCTFALTITNTGKAPFAGDVLWTDGMSIAGNATPMPITSISPSLGCAPDPAALPFSCTAPLLLAAGASITHKVTVDLPADPAGYLATNCFAVTSPSLVPADPADPFAGGALATPGVAACVDADVKASNIMPVVHKPAAPKSRACRPGVYEVRSAAGACVCRPGTWRHHGSCVPIRVVDPVKPKPLCILKAQEVRNSKGQCVCAEGYDRNRHGACVAPEKHCPPGTVGKYPVCVPIVAPKCPEGTTGRFPHCKKIEEQHCPRGTVGKFPDCKSIDKPRCPEGTTGVFPICKKVEDQHCPRGTIGKFPNCKPIDKPKCPEGTTGVFPRCKKLDIKLPDAKMPDVKKPDTKHPAKRAEPLKVDPGKTLIKKVDPPKIERQNEPKKRATEKKDPKPSGGKAEIKKLERKPLVQMLGNSKR
ncbi:MAG: hypothetical protein ACT4N2_10235 [Hyphomicrobium sp.]